MMARCFPPRAPRSLTWIKIGLESGNIMHLMDALTKENVARFAALLNERKQRLLEGIR